MTIELNNETMNIYIGDASINNTAITRGRGIGDLNWETEDDS